MAASNGSEYFEMEIGEANDMLKRPSNASSVAEDEEELRWAAIERLPSVKRMNMAFVKRSASSSSGNEPIDVRKLDRYKRELVVKNAFATNEQDNYRLLSAIKERLDKVGLVMPKIEVRYENLNIVANIHTGSRALPTLLNSTRDVIERILTKLMIIRPKKHSLTILNNVSGEVKPGRMTLLLGPPGSGKSTLLLALAGKLDGNLKKTGSITYNGHNLDEFYVQRTSAYISQTDNHLAELTVRETLDFAARCQGASDGFAGYMKDLVRLEKERNIRPSPEIDAFMKASSVGGEKHSVSTDYILKLLGLEICSETLVGSDMVRGISGGQRKRVTTGEMIVGPRKTGVADFLQEVTSRKDQAQYWADSSKPYVFISVPEIAEAFKNSRFGRSLQSSLSVPYDKSKSDSSALSKTKYAVSRYGLLVACFERELLLISRHSFLYIFRTCQVAFVGFITCTMFLRTRIHPTNEQSGSLYLSCLFYGLVHIMFNGFSELPLMITRLPVFYKQRDNYFHAAWAWNFSSWILRVPYSLVEAVVWSCVVYYTVGFAPGAGRFFRFMLLLFSIHQMALGLFRLMASIARDMVLAGIFGSAALLVVFLLGGFIIPKEMIKSWWIWAFWVSPLSYAQRAISVNEFTATRWMERSAIGNDTVGYNILKSRGLPTDDNWYWIGVAVLLAYSVLFNILVTFALAYLNPLTKARTVMPDDVAEKNLATDGVGGKGSELHQTSAREGSKKKGMILPFQPLTMTFHNVNYFVDMPKEMKREVEESLVFSSALRLPKEVSKEKKDEFVEEVMKLVELDTIRHALVGLPGSSGLSTEQRKRLTIAVELVANPSIIFMDEPTSGLDARAAAIVMRTVRNTVDTGRTVVCTIHQPSIDIFEAFDELLLMKRGGQVIYGGKLGVHSQILIDYFQGIKGTPPIPNGYNPATWMLEVTTPAAEDRIGEDFAEIYQNSKQYSDVEASIKHFSIPPAGSEPLKFSTTYSQDIFTQFRTCLWKQNLVYWRSPQYNAMRLFFTAICAILLGSIFWDVGLRRNTTQDLFMVMGALFASCVFLGVNNAASVQPIVSIERTVFYREKAAGMYSPIAYGGSQGLVEVPYIVAQTIIFGIITYFMINFERTTSKFFLYLLFMFLTFTYFTFFGMMAVGLTPSQNLAAVISSAFYSIWNLLSGFLIPIPSIPPWWLWTYYLCPVAWTLRGIISSQLGDVETKIVGDGFEGTVKEYLDFYLGYGPGMVGVSVAILIGFCLLFFLVFAISVKVLNFQKR
ncbi:hypothetical protein CMV_007280 [Castanea mollissima]|uniref:ABC transporter domain-containing protein n=1 Tax=Castanea mollissima TaxID=60419 RepID=A0A8J4R9A7_9ROSI|nr:hypothetical protein CMV_007280 [Castanea mollissima]